MKLLTIQAVAATALLVMAGCNKTQISGGSGTLSISIGNNPDVTTVSAQSKAATPDVSAFTLDILQGNTVVNRYSPIGSASKNITLAAGDYSITAYSEKFTAPKFENPVYGAVEDITISAGETESVQIMCAQTNAGISVNYSSDFKALYTTYSTLVTHSTGSLNFINGNAGKRGYFPTGEVEIEVYADGKTYTSTLTLKPRYNYNITIDKNPVVSGEEVSITINVSTDITEENVTVYFPEESSTMQGDQREVIYYENFGNIELPTQIAIAEYTGWKVKSVTYEGSNMRVAPGSTAAYEGSSGGNHAYTMTGDSYLIITGIDCSGYRKLILTIGTYAQIDPFRKDTFKVSMIVDGSPVQLNYDRSTGTAWEKLSVNLPAVTSLDLRIDCSDRYYYMDDIEISGIMN